MSETYDGDFIIEGLREYQQARAEGAWDGYEVTFPHGVNNIDPFLMVKYGNLDATLEEQLLLTKHLVVSKPVKITYYETEIGSFLLTDINQEFTIFEVFSTHPMALAMLIRIGFITVLKNLLPPLSASQRAVMEKRNKVLLTGEGKESPK
jgi:hypothetical protein